MPIQELTACAVNFETFLTQIVYIHYIVLNVLLYTIYSALVDLSDCAKEAKFENYENYLKSKRIVPQKKIPYYINWVTSCLSVAGKCSGDELTAVEINNFLKQLSKKREDWQVDQAEDALRIYQFYVKSKSPPILFTKDNEDQWRVAANEMIKMLRLKQRAISTERVYLMWLRQFYVYLKGVSPLKLDETHVKNFLTQIVVNQNISKSSQNQAFNALLFFYRHVLEKNLDNLNDVVRARSRKNIPVVLTKNEIKRLFNHLEGLYLLMAQIIYGGGLRLRECVNLRVKDVDFERGCINIIAGKGDKDRQTLLSEAVADRLKNHIDSNYPLYEMDLKNNVPGVELPKALGRKYPNAGKEWIWQWVFPSKKLSKDPITNIIRRWHIYPTTLQRKIKIASNKAQISKHVKVHTLRHSFATHLIEDGSDIRTVQELLGHSSVKTTMIYTHVAKKNMLGVKSPLDTI